MKTIILIVMGLIYSMISYTQSIVAGQVGANDYHFDVDPDYGMHPGQFVWLNKEVDINGDGITDCAIWVKNSDNNHGSYTGNCYIEPRNGSQIAYSFTDSLYVDNPFIQYPFWSIFQMARAFSNTEMIDSLQIWKSNILYLAFYRSGQYYHSNNTFSYTESKYIGVRLFVLTDTLYGWIKVNGVNAYNLILEEVACNKSFNGIKDLNNHNNFKIFPNPVADKISIEGQNEIVKSTIEIYNIKGQIEMKQIINNKNKVNVNYLIPGEYFIKLKNETGVYVTKFVKE